jgi:DNA-binding MarR family transcriptional regulator
MLMAVIETEGSQPSHLAEETFTDRFTTTGLIDRLERDGWVKRRPEVEDPGTLRIYLSSKAKRHKNKFVTIFNEINGSFMDRFTYGSLHR